jgi:hypothetical protein
MRTWSRVFSLRLPRVVHPVRLVRLTGRGSQDRGEARDRLEHPNSTCYPVLEWSARIGSLMPSGQDRWCRLRAGQPLEPLAAEVIGALTGYGLPALHRAIQEAR